MHGEFLILLNEVGQNGSLLFLGDDLQKEITSQTF